MSIYLPTRETEVGAQQPERSGARAGRAAERRELGLRWACASMHLLAGCAFVVAGALACKFVLLTSFRRGALLSLALYAAIAAAVWLAGPSGPDF
jgi:hypothetical protein